MTKLITKLSDELINELKVADEIWIAVALLNSKGLRIILDNIKIDCKQNYLIGVSLPTDPKALKELFNLKDKFDINVNIYTNNEFYHPKLYLIKKENSKICFIGSANCTNGGLNTNVELTVSIDDQTTCKQTLEWFANLYKTGKPLTKKFIKKYQEDYKKRIDLKRNDELLALNEKKNLNKEIEAIFRERKEFIKVLKFYRSQKEYSDVIKERTNSIEELRLSLDYPSFNKIDIDSFFKIWALGHIISLPKPTIKREIEKFKKLLNMLCNEDLNLANRYNLALKDEFKIKGINEGLISKILVIHRPDIYFVKNSKSKIAFKKYGIELPRGLSKGDKYEITCKVLRQICKETKIDNLAILDNYLYNEGNVLKNKKII